MPHSKQAKTPDRGTKLTKLEAQRETDHEHYRVRLSRTKYLGQSLSIASSGIPLYCIYLIADCLSGKNTTVELKWSIAIGIALSGSATLWAVISAVRAKKSKSELIRCRKRINELERRLEPES